MNNEILGKDSIEVSKLSEIEFKRKLKLATSLFNDFRKLCYIDDQIDVLED